MSRRSLLRAGYTIKHTLIGWWVDGACGYMVSGYHNSQTDAVAAADTAIADAKKARCRPVWLF